MYIPILRTWHQNTKIDLKIQWHSEQAAEMSKMFKLCDNQSESIKELLSVFISATQYAECHYI